MLNCRPVLIDSRLEIKIMNRFITEITVRNNRLLTLNMSGTISPDRLLSTLKILLSPNGGIKTRGEVVYYYNILSVEYKYRRLYLWNIVIIYMKVITIFSGRTPRILNAKVFKKTRVQSYLHPHLEILYSATP